MAIAADLEERSYLEKRCSECGSVQHAPEGCDWDRLVQEDDRLKEVESLPRYANAIHRQEEKRRWEDLRARVRVLCPDERKECRRCHEVDDFWLACRATQACIDQLRVEMERLGTEQDAERGGARHPEEYWYLRSWEEMRPVLETIHVVLDWEDRGADGEQGEAEGVCIREAAAKQAVWPALEKFDKRWSTRYAGGEAEGYKTRGTTLQEHLQSTEEEEMSSEEGD